MSKSLNTDWTDEEMARAVLEVLRRVAVDEDFKKLALSNSAEAIARVDPKPLPAGLVMKFVDNSGPLKVIPLPAPTFASEEISEEQLEAVAGGVSVGVGVGGGCVSVSVGT